MSSPHAMTRMAPIELGDTGQLTIKRAGFDGQLLFIIREHGIDRASVILKKDAVLSLIKAMCQIEGVPIVQNSILKG